MNDISTIIISGAAGSVLTVALGALLLFIRNRSDFFGQLTRSENNED